ncbi:penicillin-binding transpeptidase domain-containing protein [Pelagibacteraceae bacterium]|nr:penicillin-binding transpeptidase domain-containing protein [Pelagibacteraceae bacterium]
MKLMLLVKELNKFKSMKVRQEKSFKTTLDYEVQKYTNELLQDKAAAVCVMDVYNGDIVSLVSSPTFQPNAFVHGLDKQYWNSLITDGKKPLTNKAMSGLYPPGSTIKTLVALSALENGIIKPQDTFRCKGKIELHGEKFHCWEKKGHGIVNLRKGIQRSCDVYFYEIARKLGVDRLSKTAKNFGLGKQVLSDFVEERSGVVPNTKWKKKFIGQNWYIGETLHSGIGQGYFQSTPIQLCLMTAQIANGGYKIDPRIIFEKRDNDLRDYIKHKNEKPNESLPTNLLLKNFNIKPLFQNKENINIVKDAMFSSSNEPGGTSYRHRIENPKFTFAGKTGSSQIKRFTEAQREAEVKQVDLDYKDRDHALFVAFAPYKNPKYAISVVVEHGGSGGSAAAPIARKVIKKVIERHSLRQEVNYSKGDTV